MNFKTYFSFISLHRIWSLRDTWDTKCNLIHAKCFCCSKWKFYHKTKGIKDHCTFNSGLFSFLIYSHGDTYTHITDRRNRVPAKTYFILPFLCALFRFPQKTHRMIRNHFSWSSLALGALLWHIRILWNYIFRTQIIQMGWISIFFCHSQRALIYGEIIFCHSTSNFYLYFDCQTNVNI